MGVSINNTISQISNLVDVDVSPLSNGDALIYVSATGDWTATALPGGGDMLKATYDTDLDGVVDTAHDVSATPLITRSSVASQGGLLINIDNAIGDIARTTAGDLENNSALGIYARQDVAGWSVEADTAVTRTGSKTLKISTTSVAGAASCIIGADNREATYGGTKNRLYPLKASTKYKATCWAKTSGVATASVFITAWEWNVTYTGRAFNVSNTLTGTNDWTLLTLTFTTQAATTQGTISVANSVAGNISDAWFDINSMTLEEVVEPVANSLTSSSPSLVSFTAVGSTDNIDQSQTGTAGQASIGSSAGVKFLNSQSFTATKSKHTGVTFYKKVNTGTPTGDFLVELRTDNAGDPSATVLTSYTIPLATYNALTTNAEFTVKLPYNLTAGTKYHYVCSDTVSEAGTNSFTIAAATGGYSGGDSRYSSDGGTIWTINGTSDFYFKTLYYKPTTNFKASQNNSTMQISADEDGFLDGSVINLTTGAFTTPDLIKSKWSGAVTDYSYQGLDVRKFLSYHSATSVAWASGTAYNIVVPTATGNGTGYVVKVKLPVNITSLNVSYAGNTTSGTSILRYSYDLVTWYTLGTNFHPSEFDAIFTTYKSYSFVPTSNTVYIEFGLVGGTPRIGGMVISGTVDVSSLPTLRNYPTNKDVVTTYNKSLNTATTTATYRATKWGFPAIEYSATEYQFLDVDTTATGSTVTFSADGVSYTTVADGANIALSSTTTPLVWVKTNITANRLYLSSNDYNASGDKDGSNKMTVGYEVTSQGLTYDVRELQEDVEALMIASGKVVTAITGDIRTEADVYTITPTATGNINLLDIPPAGKKFTLLVKTSGTTSYTLTFNTAFKSTGALATGVVDAKYFALEFISDGTQALELSRTTAM